MKKSAFTMIELVFVIVVLGILAAVAIPRMSATRTDAQIAKAKSDIASIRSSIITERQSRLLSGNSSYITELDDATENVEDEIIFDGNSTNPILMYGITTKDANGHWMKTGEDEYTFKVENTSVVFTYQSSGKFDCNTSASNVDEAEYCKLLTQ